MTERYYDLSRSTEYSTHASACLPSTWLRALVAPPASSLRTVLCNLSHGRSTTECPKQPVQEFCALAIPYQVRLAALPPITRWLQESWRYDL